MLLTLSASANSEYGCKSPHDFPPPIPLPTKTLSPLPLRKSENSRSSSMSLPPRGLPPPAAMTLPDPARSLPSTMPSLGQMPNPPAQWQGAEDSMRNWLAAKAEEDKRRQEEERTRQESLRLEQRKIESAMLRDSMAGGVPPYMVPIIFAGIGGGKLANMSLDWIQQNAASLQVSQQHPLATSQPPQASPDSQRETRLASTPQYGAPPPPPSAPSGPPLAPQVLQGQQGGSFAYSPAAGAVSPRGRAQALALQGPTSAPRPPAAPSTLPRLATTELQIHQAPALHSAPVAREGSPSSPSICFHHWVPPSSSSAAAGGKDQPAPSTDYVTSPKKRKDTRPHQAAPIPTSAPMSGPPYASPSFSHHSSSNSTPAGATRGRHARARSDHSSRGFGASNHARSGASNGSSRHTTPPGNGRGDARRDRTASDSARSSGSMTGVGTAGSGPTSPRANIEQA